MSPRQRLLLCGASLLVLALELPALLSAVGDGLQGPWAGGARELQAATLAPAAGDAPEAGVSRLAALALTAEAARD